MLGTTAALGEANKAARHDVTGWKPVSFNDLVGRRAPEIFPADLIAKPSPFPLAITCSGHPPNELQPLLRGTPLSLRPDPSAQRTGPSVDVHKAQSSTHLPQVTLQPPRHALHDL
jgi:hypothetical protein